MLASIHPLGERARRSRWWLTAGAYVVGSAAGGALLGGLAGAVGSLGHPWLPHRTPVLLVVAVCLAAGCLDLAHRRVRLPSWHRQVNEDWLHRYRGWVYGLGFGFQLGLGVVTIVTTAAVYAVVVLAALVASVGGGIVVGTMFGLARAVPVLAMAGVHRPEQLRAAHRRLSAAAAPVRMATSSLLVLAGAGMWWAR